MKHFLLLIVLFLFPGCSDGHELPEDPGDDGGAPVYDTAIDVSCMRVSPGGRKYLEVDGTPFLMLGAQLRTDYFLQLENKTPDQLDAYFDLAKKLNITVIQVPIAWRDIEPEKNRYDPTLVNQYIRYCNKYDLKLEILWFGSYMCGYSVRGYIPDYVVNNTRTYPELNAAAAYNGWLGKHYFLTPNTPELVERESKAIAYMMDAVWEYDRKHDGRRTVVGIQIENEADMLATRHNEAHGFQPDDLWDGLIQMLDQLGRVVKESKYRCYTRTNLTTTYPGFLERSAQLVATPGIDFVGLDPYENTIGQIRDKLAGLDAIPGNFAHIAENGGEYENNDLLTLQAFTQGAGYEVFEVVTTSHPYLADWTLRGVYHPDFTPKSHTRRLIDAYKIFNQGWYDLAIAEICNIKGFNLQDDEGLINTSETRQTTNCTILWETAERGVAYAVENSGYLLVASTKSDRMTIQGIDPGSIEKGSYNTAGEWKTEGTVSLQEGVLLLSPCTVYRIRLVN